MASEIRLTKDELEEIKDTVRFREKTTLTLKRLVTKLDDGFFDRVERLEVHRTIQWWLITVIIIGIAGVAFATFGK